MTPIILFFRSSEHENAYENIPEEEGKVHSTQCDPCLPVSMPSPLPLCDRDRQEGACLPTSTTVLPHPPPAKVHTQTVSRLGLSCGLEVLGVPSSPVHFRRLF